MKKVIQVALSCLMMSVLLFSTVLPAFAAGNTAAEDTPYLNYKLFGQVNTADNDLVTYPEGYDHGYIPKVRTVQSADGSYTVCVDEGTQLRILEVDKKRSFKSSITLPMELEKYACFAKGKTNGCYYVLFAKARAQSTSDVMLRLVEYNTSGVKLRSLDLSAMPAASLHGIKELGYGNNDMVADDNLITAFIGRKMFYSQGEEHQASYAFAVRTSDFKQVNYNNSNFTPYASHSFHEAIVPDGDSYVYIDRCDNVPNRSFVLTKMTGRNWVKVTDETAHSFLFKGAPFTYDASGNPIYGNNTYSQYGGLIPLANKYMLIGSYQNNEAVLTESSANLFVQFFDKNTLKPMADASILTNWNDVEGQSPCFRTIQNPQAVRIDGHRVAVLYLLYNKTFLRSQLRLMIVDDYGAVLSDEAVETKANRSFVLPRFGSVFYNSEKKAVEWFTVQTDESGNHNLTMRYVETESSPALTPPQSLTINNPTVNLPINTAVRASYTFTPADAGNYISWKSNDESIVKVDPMGVLIGVGNGTTTVTATLRSGATQQITVSVTGGKPATNMVVKFAAPGGTPTDAEESMSVQKGDSYSIYVNTLPADASNRTYSVSTDRPDIVSVLPDKSGWKAVGGGRASLTIASVSNPEIRRVYHISVYAPGEEYGSDLYAAGDLVTFGSYPQTLVKDTALITALNREADNYAWNSYSYGAMSESAGSGTGTFSEYMFYKDFAFNGAKYRAVLFNAFRPTSAGGVSPQAGQSYQHQNGYEVDQVYYFKYEPLVWRVLDPDSGYMVCTKAIDSQAFRDFDAAAAPSVASDWASSSLRSWLNNEDRGFYYTAFDDNEQVYIIEQPSPDGQGDDPVSLLSAQDIVGYAFDPDAAREDPTRVMPVTDYARCQGVSVLSADGTGGSAGWWLNAPRQNTRVGIVSADGRCDSDYSVQLNNIGVVPALHIVTTDVSVNRIEMTLSDTVKTVYEIGEDLNLSGIGLSAYYSNCSGKDVSLDECSILNWNSSVAGEKTVTIKYYGQTVTLKVTVVKSLASLEITKPSKLTYLIGEPLDLSGMSVRAKYTDGSTVALYSSNYKVSSFDSSTSGQKEIVISYQNLTASFTVTVRAVGQLIITPPTKQSYCYGEPLDLTGLSVRAVYDDGTSAVLDNANFTVSTIDTTTPGEKTVTISYAGYTETFTVRVKAVARLVITPPTKQSYCYGEPLDLTGLSVRAVYDDGTSAVLDNANFTVSTIDTTTPGEKTVTITYAGYSETITVRVKAVSQLIITPPNKVDYYYGQPLDLTGLSVRAVYDDGTSAVLENANFTVSTIDSTTPGEKMVTVSYAGYSETFTVRVRSIEALLVTPPTKTEYAPGQQLDLSGLTVKAKYDNGQTVTLQASEYSVSAFDPSKTGSQTLTVTYAGVSASFTVTVKAIELQSIRITTMPKKQIYKANETLDTTGMVLEATYTNGSKKTVSTGFTASADLRSVGRKTVTVQYTESGVTKSATYEVTVELAANTEIRILGYTKSRSVEYKATVTFHYEAKNVYAGSSVHWFINGEDKGKSDTYRVEKAKASYTVQIKLIASDGKTVLKESEVEQVNVKTGLFAKIIAFFKGLFGMLQKIDQK